MPFKFERTTENGKLNGKWCVTHFQARILSEQQALFGLLQTRHFKFKLMYVSSADTSNEKKKRFLRDNGIVFFQKSFDTDIS